MVQFVLSRTWRRILVILVVYVLYLVFGMEMFMYLEALPYRDRDKHYHELYHRIRNTLHTYNFTVKDITAAINLYGTDTDTSKHQGIIETYVRSIFFALTMITTIGYGAVSPRTKLGRIATIMFSCIGIPLHIFLMRFIIGQFENQYRVLKNGVKTRWHHSKAKAKLASILYVATLMFLFLGLPPILFMFTEKWSYLEGLYYSLVTLTTVGLGDYVAGDSLMTSNYYTLYMCVIITWIIFGLGFVCIIFIHINDFMRAIIFRITACFELKSEDAIQPINSEHSDDEDQAQEATLEERYADIMGLTENDELTDRHIQELDTLLEEFERKVNFDLEFLKRRKDAVLQKQSPVYEVATPSSV